MVRLPRPESAACAAQSGISVTCRKGFARIADRVSALAAIIDGGYSPSSFRSSLLHAFSLICPSSSARTHSTGVYPLSSCAGVFALAIHSIQNQGTGLPRPFGSHGNPLDRRQASAAPGFRRPGHITS